MFRLHSLRTARVPRLVVLFAYLCVVASTLLVPVLQPSAMGSVCSVGTTGTAGGDGDTSPAIGCALCLPAAAPPHAGAAATITQFGPEPWLGQPDRTLSEPQPAAMPPARGPPAV
ncbi:MAG: hypothetical protein U1E89_19840 [Burkholderiaceae bacterium]